MNKFGLEKQKLIIETLVKYTDDYIVVQNILQPDYFHDELAPAVKFIKKHADEYRNVPSLDQIRAETGIHLTPIDDVDRNWVLKETEIFCKQKAMEKAILSSVELLKLGDFDAVEQNIREAALVGLHKSLGVSYYDEAADSIIRLRDRNKTISTGFKVIDEKLYGGVSAGELNIFAGGSGSGKSLFLQNIARYWSLMGLNVVYITCELSEDYVSMRLSAMHNNTPTKLLFSSPDDLRVMTSQLKKNSAGDIDIIYMGSGTNANQIRSYLKEYEIQKKRKADALIIDYLDLLSPNSKHIRQDDLFIKDKFVSEEIRSLLMEENLLNFTASQLNRGAVEATEHDHSHISGGISKINTADNVMTIYINQQLREQGLYRIQFIKTRSSAGIGHKVFLGFDVNSLRIFDVDKQPTDDNSPDDTNILDPMARLTQLRQNTKRSTFRPSPDQISEKAKTTDQINSLINKMPNKKS